mgnify:CR=1 FL=1
MFNEKTYSQKMDKTIEVFQKELTSLRTGRANSSMLDLVKVDVYGQAMPLNQVSSITTPDARTINIQVWDLNNVPLVDTAIKKSELGLNPQIDGQLIRLPVPDLNEERRTEIKKLIKSMGEKCKISIRNIRREANDELKSLLKDKDLGEDDEKKFVHNGYGLERKELMYNDFIVIGPKNDPENLRLKDNIKDWRQEFFYEHAIIKNKEFIPASEALVRKEIKYIFWPDFNTEELYDLKNDPLEENNVVKSESYQELLNQLRVQFKKLKSEAR